MSELRIGSLCSGYCGGLDIAVQAVFGGEVVWFAEADTDASRVLAYHWPAVPNHQDLTAVDWSSVEPVDVVCAGYPCQPFSAAGKRKGVEDERHIWPYIAVALRQLRPHLLVLENVRGHLGRGFTAVLGDLAALGFDARWQVVRASDIGAPHQRARLFVLAWQAARDADGIDRQGRSPEQQPRQTRSASGSAAHPAHHRHERARSARQWWTGSAHGGVPAANTGRPGLEVRPVEHHEPQRPAIERDRGEPAVSDAPGDGRYEGRPEPAWLLGGPDAALGGTEAPADPAGQRHRDAGTTRGRGIPAAAVASAAADPDGEPVRQQPVPERGSGGPAVPAFPDIEWGPYKPAIRRWEGATGRAAPAPTEPGRTGARLSPVFVEWLLGLAEGHVTAVPGISRNAMLRILGNGVVPQQAEAALALLLADMEVGPRSQE